MKAIISKKYSLIVVIIAVLSGIFTIGLVPWCVPTLGANASFVDLIGHIIYILPTAPTSVVRIDPVSKKVEAIYKPPDQGIVFGFDSIIDGSIRVLSLTNGLAQPKALWLMKDDKLNRVTCEREIVGFYPSLAPDGRQIAYLGKVGISVAAIDGTSKTQVSGMNYQRDMKPAWFPDNRTLIVSSPGWRIYSVDIITGSEKEIIDFGKAPAVSHDGKKIAYLSREGDEEDKQALRDMQRYEGAYDKFLKQLRWRKRFTWNDRLAIYVYDVDAGKSTRITDNLNLETPPVWSPDDRYLAYTEHKYKTTHNRAFQC